MAKFNVREYHCTGKSAMVHGYTRPIDSFEAEDKGIEMVLCESISQGSYKIFVADTAMLYSRCGHVAREDKVNIYEVRGVVKVSEMTKNQLHWILAYCYYNQLVVDLSNDRLTVSIFETTESINEGNLHGHSQHFRVIFNKFNAVFTGIYYDKNGKADAEAVKSYNDAIGYFQLKSEKKSITDKRYFCE